MASEGVKSMNIKIQYCASWGHQPRAASFAAELQEKLNGATVEIENGTQKSEFAVFLDENLIFSRLERRRFPELKDVIDL